MIKPVCVSDTSLLSTFFNLAVEAILYTTDSKEIGLQFYRNSQDFFPLRKQFIMQVLSERDSWLGFQENREELKA